MRNINLNLYDDLKGELKASTSKMIVFKYPDIIRFSLGGLKTLMTFLREDPDFLMDTLVFDKIVGKSAAALLVLARVKEVYAEVISEHAVKLFDYYKIKFEYNQKVPFIENKARNGFCPIELISIQCEFPTEIYIKLYGLYSKIPSEMEGWSKIFK